jgi:hypothetical protein
MEWADEKLAAHHRRTSQSKQTSSPQNQADGGKQYIETSRLKIQVHATTSLTTTARWAAVSDMRRAPHDGQNPRLLHENATSLSWAQSPQRSRRKPWARMPHSRKASNSSLTNFGRALPVAVSSALGHSASGRWVSFSVTKSLTSTLVGAAIKDGFISSVHDPVTRYIPELTGSAYDGVTVHHLLTMTSGVKWNEDYTDPNADIALFYTAPLEPGLDATASYMKKLVRDSAPGQKWRYNTGETNLIGVLVARATKKSLASYASEKVWSRYGMEQDASWMLARTNHEHGGCCVQASTRDLARLGLFMLDGARIDGQAVTADGWLEAATRKQADFGDPVMGYGYQWWTRADGSFNALGIHGQHIQVDPGRQIVIVVNSAWPNADFTPASLAARTALFNAIRAALDSE